MTKGQRAISVVSIGTAAICSAWIVGTTVARGQVTLSTDLQSTVASNAAGPLMAIALTGAVVVLAFGRFGGVGCIALAAGASALIAEQRIDPWDALAFFLALCATRLILGASGESADGKKRSGRWGGVVLAGSSAGCSPLAVGCLLALLPGSHKGTRKIAEIVVFLVVAAGGAWLISSVGGRDVKSAFALGHDIAGVAPQDVWRFAARWIDWFVPAIVFALLGIADYLFGVESDANDSERRRRAILATWFGVNVLVGTFFPRQFVAHGLPLMVPVYLLIPSGCEVFKSLPFDRRNWSLTVFSVVCFAIPIAVLVAPLKKAGGVILVALFGQ